MSTVRGETGLESETCEREAQFAVTFLLRRIAELLFLFLTILEYVEVSAVLEMWLVVVWVLGLDRWVAVGRWR